MADQYTPEEINRIAAEHAESMQKTGKVSGELAERMKDANAGIKNYTYQLNQSIKGLGTSLKGMMGSVKDGAEGASAFNSSIESAADVIDSFASKFGILGMIIGKLITAGAKYVVEVNKQSDALYKAYQDLGKVGSTTADGMAGVYKQMQQFGYGVEQLGKFTELIQQNATTLANFGGTVSTGTKIFADAAAEVQKNPIGRQLQMLGKTPDEINKGIAGFIQNQNSLGRGQQDIQKSLKAETGEYLKNLDLLSRLTGEDADSIQKKQQEALKVDQYNATQFLLQQKKDAGDEQAGLQLKVNEQIVGSLKGSLKDIYTKSVGGDQASMAKLYQVSARAAQMVNDGVTDYSEFMQVLSEDAGEYQERVAKFASLGGDIQQFGISMVEAGEAAGRTRDETVAQQKARAQSEQAALVSGKADITAATDLRIQQQQQKAASQDLINAGIKPVTKAMEKLAGVTNKVAQAPGALAPKALGVTGPEGVGQQGGGAKPTSVQELLGFGKKTAPGATPGAPGATPAAPVIKSQTDLKSMGLTLKEGDVQNEGSEISPQLIELAKQIQGSIPGFSYFSGFNDKFHQEKASSSTHTKGRAVDFALASKPTPEQGKQIADLLRSMGASYVQDEYNNPSSKATAGHFHAEVSAAEGAILSGPTSGYQPNLTMHGTEAIVPMSKIDAMAEGITSGSEAMNDLMSKQLGSMAEGITSSSEVMNGLMSQQLEKLDELVRAMQNQVSVSNKILQHTQ
jgi:hypothetical protein